MKFEVYYRTKYIQFDNVNDLKAHMRVQYQTNVGNFKIIIKVKNEFKAHTVLKM